MVTVNAVLPLMRDRKQGHIALIASLAALNPLADAPAYSASRRALQPTARRCVRCWPRRGIAVSIVCPGHIDTDQTDVRSDPCPS